MIEANSFSGNAIYPSLHRLCMILSANFPALYAEYIYGFKGNINRRTVILKPLQVIQLIEYCRTSPEMADFLNKCYYRKN